MSKGKIRAYAYLASLGFAVSFALHLSTFFLRVSFTRLFAEFMLPLHLGAILLFIPTIFAMVYISRAKLGWHSFYRCSPIIWFLLIPTCLLYTLLNFFFAMTANQERGNLEKIMALALRNFSGFWMFFFLAQTWVLRTYYRMVWAEGNRDQS